MLPKIAVRSVQCVLEVALRPADPRASVSRWFVTALDSGNANTQRKAIDKQLSTVRAHTQKKPTRPL